MARFLHGKLEKLNMFERNLTPRSEMFASQSKLEITLTFEPKFSQLARKMSLNQFLLFFFLLKKRKSVYSSFQREIPCSRPLTVFFFLQKRLYWPKFSELTCKTWLKQFFIQRKNYSLFQREIPSCAWHLVLITHSILFYFPLLLLRVKEVDFIGCY